MKKLEKTSDEREIQHLKICGNCHEPLDDDFKYCPECGYKIL